MPLPSSLPQPALDLQGVQPAIAPAPAFDSLSAIGKLQALTDQGVLSTAQVAQLLAGVPTKQAQAQGAVADDTRSLANANIAIRPAQVALDQAQLGADLSNVPIKARAANTGAQLTIDQNTGKSTVVPSQTAAEIAANNAAAAGSAVAGAKAGQELQTASLPASTLAVMNAFTSATGEAPLGTDPESLEKMRNITAAVFSNKTGISGDDVGPGGSATPGQLDFMQRKKIRDTATAKGIPVVDDDGTPRPIADIDRDISLGGTPTVNELKASASMIRNITQNLRDLEQVRQSIEQDPNIVGGGMTQGSDAHQAASRVGAFFGIPGSQDKLDKWQQLERFKNSSTLVGGSDMGLAASIGRSVSGLKMEAGQMPAVGKASANAWLQWLDDREAKLRAGLDANEELIRTAPPARRAALGDQAGFLPPTPSSSISIRARPSIAGVNVAPAAPAAAVAAPRAPAIAGSREEAVQSGQQYYVDQNGVVRALPNSAQ